MFWTASRVSTLNKVIISKWVILYIVADRHFLWVSFTTLVTFEKLMGYICEIIFLSYKTLTIGFWTACRIVFLSKLVFSLMSILIVVTNCHFTRTFPTTLITILILVYQPNEIILMSNLLLARFLGTAGTESISGKFIFSSWVLLIIADSH